MDPTEIDGGGSEHIAPLTSDSVPDANQSHHCFSCETPITGLYCANCGQKNDNYRRSIFSLINEVFQSFTAIESRIWRTWAALLFKPGKVAREYADGRRTHWSTPVRVYLAMSILLFTFINVTQMQLISIDIDVQPKAGIEKPIEELKGDDLTFVSAVHFFETQKQIDVRNASRNFDLITRKIEADDGIKLDIDTDAPSEDPEYVEDADDKNETSESPPETSPLIQRERLREAAKSLKQDNAEGEEKGITFNSFNGKTYRLDSWSSIVLTVIQNPNTLNAAFYKYLPRILFLMMPFTMLIGAMFIRGRGNALMYDHLVHAAYIHAVAFFLLFIGIVSSLIAPASAVPPVLCIILLIYLPLSLKRMFGRGWIKTVWTSYGVGLIYAVNMFFIMLFLLIWQLATTVTELGTPLTP